MADNQDPVWSVCTQCGAVVALADVHTADHAETTRLMGVLADRITDVETAVANLTGSTP